MKAKILFCDALSVYQKLIQDGLVQSDVPLVTRSFVMAEMFQKGCIYIDGNMSAAQRQQFKSDIANVEHQLVKKLDISEFSEPVKNIFLQLFNGFQNDILDALLLETVFDKDCSMIVAVPKTDQVKIDEVMHPCWIQWLQGTDALQVVTIDVPYHNERAPRGNVETSFMKRIWLGGYEAIFWKLAQQKWLPGWLFKPNKIGALGQTELARDGVINCLKHGYKPVFIQRPKLLKAQLEPNIELAKTVIKTCYPIIKDRLALISNKFLRDRAEEIFLDRLANDFGKYKFFIRAWQQELSAYPDISCILSGYGKGPDAMALSTVCKARRIKIAAFQHGITREILSHVEERRVFFETSFCDLFFTMNPAAAEITRHKSVRDSVTIIPTSWPSPFKRVAARPTKAKKRALFVSTNLYFGHKPNGVPPLNDRELCDLEMRLVKRVFGKIDMEIDYKPYPAIRQLDPDPVLKAVKERRNLRVIGTHQELRYMLHNYGMFITTKATSTVSWIVATKKPLIFIDHHCHARLSDECRQAFSEGFFLFDQSDTNFELSLRTFLQRPFDEILEAWESKSVQRAETIKQFFGGDEKNCRDVIFKYIKHHCLDV